MALVVPDTQKITAMGGERLPVIDIYSRPTQKADAGADMAGLAQALGKLGVQFNNVSEGQTQAKEEADMRKIDHYANMVRQEIKDGVPSLVQLGQVLPETSMAVRGRVAESLGYTAGQDWVNGQLEQIMSDPDLMLDPDAMNARLQGLRGQAAAMGRDNPAYGAGAARAINGAVGQASQNASAARSKLYREQQEIQFGREALEALDGEGDPGRPAVPVSPGASGGASSSTGGSPIANKEDLVSAVKGFEGFTATASWDYKQHSVGYGTRGKPGETITREQADVRLRQELGKAEAMVERFAPDAPEGVKMALISLTFNAGSAWMKSGLGAKIKSGDYAGAKQSFLQYNKAGGEVLPGLVKRRQAEAKWFDLASNPRSAGAIDPVPPVPPTSFGKPVQVASLDNGTMTDADPVSAPQSPSDAPTQVADASGGYVPGYASTAPEGASTDSGDAPVSPQVEAARNRVRQLDHAWSRSGGLTQEVRRQQFIDKAIEEAGRRLDPSYLDRIPPEMVGKENEGRMVEAYRKIEGARASYLSAQASAREAERKARQRQRKAGIDQQHASGGTINPATYADDPDLYEHALKRQREEAFVDPSWSHTNMNKAQTQVEQAALTGSWDALGIAFTGEAPSREEVDNWIDDLPDMKAADRAKLKEQVPRLMEQGIFVGGTEAKEWFDRYLGKSVDMMQANLMNQNPMKAKDYRSAAQDAYDTSLRMSFKAYVEDHGKPPTGKAKMDIYRQATQDAKDAMDDMRKLKVDSGGEQKVNNSGSAPAPAPATPAKPSRPIIRTSPDGKKEKLEGGKWVPTND